MARKSATQSPGATSSETKTLRIFSPKSRAARTSTCGSSRRTWADRASVVIDGPGREAMRNSSHALPSPGPTLLSGFLQPADELQVARHANKPVGPCSSFQHLSRPLPVAGTIALQQGHRMKTRHLRFFDTVREFVSEFQGGREMLLCRIPIS